MTQVHKPHVSEFKKKEIEEIKKLFEKYSVTGIINLEGLPTLMLQRMKFALGDTVSLKITKKRLMKIAIDELSKSKKNIDQLKDKLDGIPALIFTDEDPFLLYKKLEKNKASAAAKVGQKAPNDLGIEAGETPFAPGPMIGELGMLGLKTEVKGGKIHIKDDKILVKDGEEISEQVAGILSKMGVEPMKIGLNLTYTYQDGEILDKSILSIDEEEYINNIKAAYSESFALSIELGIINGETVKPIICKAQAEALALADSAEIMTSENVGKILAKAESAASSINENVPETAIEETEEAPKGEEKDTSTKEASDKDKKETDNTQNEEKK
tara:strand:- start:70 stop:1050 length:981 start_codon:yes stop_codon:yes gene_type:complete